MLICSDGQKAIAKCFQGQFEVQFQPIGSVAAKTEVVNERLPPMVVNSRAPKTVEQPVGNEQQNDEPQIGGSSQEVEEETEVNQGHFHSNAAFCSLLAFGFLSI